MFPHRFLNHICNCQNKLFLSLYKPNPLLEYVPKFRLVIAISVPPNLHLIQFLPFNIYRTELILSFSYFFQPSIFYCKVLALIFVVKKCLIMTSYLNLSNLNLILFILFLGNPVLKGCFHYVQAPLVLVIHYLFNDLFPVLLVQNSVTPLVDAPFSLVVIVPCKVV
jgi:hypothetical protein